MDETGGSFLPYYLKSSVRASVQVDSLVVDSAPNIVILTTDGYMYEVKAKKIVNSLNLEKETGSTVFCAYVHENGKLLIFYLVRTTSGRLIIIKRSNCRLEVIKIYEDVKSFEIYDFMCLGYPQIKIKSEESFVVKFPVNNSKLVVNESECGEHETNLNLSKSLSEKLQIICRHVEELTEELYSIKEVCQLITPNDFHLLPNDTIKFSFTLEKCAEKITVVAKWIKIIGGKLVIGIKIHYDGKEVISDLEFKIHEKQIKEYSYRFFWLDDDCMMCTKKTPVFSIRETSLSIHPGQEFTIVGAVSIDFLNSPFSKTLQVSCYLTSAKLKNYLLRETFEMNVSDMVAYSNTYFFSINQNFSVEDIQAIKTAKSETKLKVETKNSASKCLENILERSLGFTRVISSKELLYYCISTCLSEVFVAVQQVTLGEPVWKIILWTRDESQVYLFVNVLYELLPEYTTILLDEN